MRSMLSMRLLKDYACFMHAFQAGTVDVFASIYAQRDNCDTFESRLAVCQRMHRIDRTDQTVQACTDCAKLMPGIHACAAGK